MTLPIIYRQVCSSAHKTTHKKYTLSPQRNNDNNNKESNHTTQLTIVFKETQWILKDIGVGATNLQRGRPEHVLDDGRNEKGCWGGTLKTEQGYAKEPRTGILQQWDHAGHDKGNSRQQKGYHGKGRHDQQATGNRPIGLLQYPPELNCYCLELGTLVVVRLLIPSATQNAIEKGHWRLVGKKLNATRYHKWCMPCLSLRTYSPYSMA